MKSSSPVRFYRIYGLSLATDLGFKNRLGTGAPPADLTFRCPVEPLAELDDLEASSRNPSPTPGRGNPSRLFRLGALDVLRFTDVADYYVGDDRIDCHLRDPLRRYLVEIELLGPVLSFWLERRGLPTLHASAVDVGGLAVAFLSSKHGGKTSLAATLLRQGYSLLTDDVLPLEERGGTFLGRPGYPQMRMWPDQAARYLERWQELELIHPGYSKRRVPVGPGGLGRFCDASRPLACIYLPQRRSGASGGVEIVPLKPRDAAIELVRHSFSPYLVDAMGWQAERLDFFARLVQRVPVRRVLYSSGFEHLPAVRDGILEDKRQGARAGTPT